ncbi:hypothetical protein LR48_Vigan10g025600 [Vigna angularis]|uniref:Uncharacterized protein n=1 Tax=Phaseolus angularis TaxID=3914 RepID=A0A0L9VI29_PHAAN|nr:hypothetical protein LR48_Vigan10g025600 [Vigna angularis]
MSDGPNIDLALVYANFLNQNPSSESGIESSNPDQVRTAFDPSLENNSRLSNTDVSDPSTLPEEIALTGCLNLPEQPSTHSAEANNGGQICYGDFNSMQTIQKGGIQQCSSHYLVKWKRHRHLLQIAPSSSREKTRATRWRFHLHRTTSCKPTHQPPTTCRNQTKKPETQKTHHEATIPILASHKKP